jgi:hypothetical protein
VSLLRVLLVALLMAVALAGAARPQDDEQPQVTLRVDPPTGEVGLIMVLMVSVNGVAGADCALAELPQIPGARFTQMQGPSNESSSIYVNGQLTKTMRTTWRLGFVPEREGTLEIPPLRFNCRGEELLTQPVSVPVAKSALKPGIADLELRPSTDSLWAGQIVQVEVSASIDEASLEKLTRNGLELDLPWYDGVPGLMRLDSAPLSGEATSVRLSGRRDMLEMRLRRDDATRRIVFSRTIDMLATAAGTIEFPQSRFSACLALVTEPDRSTPIGSIFGGQPLVVTRAAIVDATAPGPVLEVRAPPEAGRPASFTNAVGRFRFTGTAAPDTLRVGDTCTLTLTLTGDGNLEFAEWPEFAELSQDFRIFGKSERRMPRTRVLELQVSPKTTRVTEVPALKFSAFDPEQGAYEELTAGPFPLSVSAGGDEGLATLESPADTLSSLETIRETLPAPAGSGVPAWVWVLPGALLLLLVDARSRRATWRARNPRLLAQRGARPALDAALAAAQDAHAVRAAFAHFLAARLDGPPAGLTADEAAARLSDAALAADLRRVLSGWEASALGGAPFDLQAARAEAVRLAERVEAQP